MLVPLSWLADYVELPANPAELAEKLTSAGLEVSGARIYGQEVPAGLRVAPEDAGLPWPKDKIVVARVLEISKHPNADKLKLVKLDYGAAEPKTVVTGAPNIAPGQSGMKVTLGLRGSRYFALDKENKKVILTLEPKELRGIPNDAMCMSDYELGISEDHDGIILLDESDPAPGTPIAEFLSEVVLEVDVLPNMARCLALLGVAGEVAALTGKALQSPNREYSTVPESIVGKVEVKIETPLCARYSATLVRNVRVGSAPRAIRSRLRTAGMRPINNIVDITNYVMLETGRPLHAFDYDSLVNRAGGNSPTITVRLAREGETLKTLDGQVRALVMDDLVIADSVGPIALAGVMGGSETEVTAATRTILLEAATFDPVSIRKTARKFNLFSESSTRFSRGVDAATVVDDAARAATFLAACGEVLTGIVDVVKTPHQVQVVKLDRAEIVRLLGTEVVDGEVERILTALQFQLEATPWGWNVTVPSRRLDIQAGAADLIEEIARVSGYARLPESPLPLPLPDQVGNPELDFEERLRDLLVDAGLREATTYSLTSRERESQLVPGGGGNKSNVEVINPVSPERSILRTTLLPGLFEAARHNLQGHDSVALFEIGTRFAFVSDNDLPHETSGLGIVVTGRKTPANWDDPIGTTPPSYDFYDLKGMIETALGMFPLTFRRAENPDCYHPGRVAEVVVSGNVVGRFGELHPKVALAFDLGERPVLAGEFNVAMLFSLLPSRHGFRSISPFPPVLRDVAVVVEEKVPAHDVLATIRTAGGEELESARLFDLYRGENIPAETKSLAYALTYRLASRQLVDKEVDKLHDRIENELRKTFGARIRGKDGV